MEGSGWVASLTFLLAVPASIWLAFEGHYVGMYSYRFIPIAFGLIVGALLALLLLVVLPALNKDW